MKVAWVALAAVLGLRLVLAASLPLVDDEAYYWTWSRQLDLGYFDHPPAIAWLIRAGTIFLGDTELGVRLVPVLAGVVSAALLLPFARDPLRFALLVAGIPLYALGGVVATPDVPLLLGWALALRGALSRQWLVLGLGIGVAGLGKYTGYGLWPLVAAWVLYARAWTLLPGLLLGPLFWTPNLYWNATHDWASLAFQLGHGLDRPPAGALAFFAAQVGLAGPLFFLVFLAWAARRPRGDDALLWLTSLPVVAFFTWAATRGSGEANWAAAAYLSAALGLARVDGRLARASWIAAGTGLALCSLVVAHLVDPLVPIKNDPVARLGRGVEMARSVQAWGIEPVYTSRYQEAAMISFYGGLEAYALPGVDRPDQYDYWPVRWAKHALFVREYRSGLAATVDDFCADRQGGDVVREGQSRWQVYEVRDCGPAELRSPDPAPN